MDPTPTFIQFTLDQSGSMEGPKMDYVKRTIINIIQVILDMSMPIHIKVDGFNSKYTNIIPFTDVTKENISELIDKVSNITTISVTNIEQAIKNSQSSLLAYKKLADKHASKYKQYHFFLTDGEATEGECDKNVLADLISTEIPTIFIGYGEDHEEDLLIKCASRHPKSSYQFVSNIETIGELCGELLNEICYPILDRVILKTSEPNEYIFDTRTNEWSNQVFINQLTSDKEYTFQLYTLSSGPFSKLTLTGIDMIHSNIILKYVYDDEQIETDLTTNMFQLKTNQLLFDVIIKKDGTYDALKILFQKVRKYVRENDLLEDPVFKVMFDDIYLAYENYYRNTGLMYAFSRHNSNNHQQNYRPLAQTPTEQTNGLFRSPSTQYYQYDEETQVEDYMISGVENSDDIHKYIPQIYQMDLNITQTMQDIITQISS
jgi:uncharacterized protein YegL